MGTDIFFSTVNGNPKIFSPYHFLLSCITTKMWIIIRFSVKKIRKLPLDSYNDEDFFFYMRKRTLFPISLREGPLVFPFQPVRGTLFSHSRKFLVNSPIISKIGMIS